MLDSSDKRVQSCTQCHRLLWLSARPLRLPRCAAGVVGCQQMSYFVKENKWDVSWVSIVSGLLGVDCYRGAVWSRSPCSVPIEPLALTHLLTLSSHQPSCHTPHPLCRLPRRRWHGSISSRVQHPHSRHRFNLHDFMLLPEFKLKKKFTAKLWVGSIIFHQHTTLSSIVFALLWCIYISYLVLLFSYCPAFFSVVFDFVLLCVWEKE